MVNKISITIIYMLCMAGSCKAQSVISNYYDYNKIVNPQPIPAYRDYLKLDYLPIGTRFDPLIRQPNAIYPGDFFWPPDWHIPNQYRDPKILSNIIPGEKAQIINYITANLPARFSNLEVVSFLKAYAYNYPNGPHREIYTMLTEGDTVYVVSGWLGKFLSFYRVEPGDHRLSVPELMKQLEQITPLSKEIKEGGFRHVSDSLNYLLEYVDKDKMFRIRNYLLKATLPPDPPDAPEKFYNLIEVTRFYDREAMP